MVHLFLFIFMFSSIYAKQLESVIKFAKEKDDIEDYFYETLSEPEEFSLKDSLNINYLVYNNEACIITEKNGFFLINCSIENETELEKVNSHLVDTQIKLHYFEENYHKTWSGQAKNYWFSTGLGVGAAYAVNKIFNVEAHLLDAFSVSFSGISSTSGSQYSLLANLGWFTKKTFIQPYVSIGTVPYPAWNDRKEMYDYKQNSASGLGLKIFFLPSKRAAFEGGYYLVGTNEGSKQYLSLGIRIHWLKK